jgi:RND family efflux transporter MFP subunit
MMPDLRLDYTESYEQWQAYLDAFDIHKTLKEMPKPKTNKEKRFIAAKNIYTNYYSIKNLEIKLDKYTIRAPFNGVLTEASVTPGSLVSPGQMLGEFVNPAVYEMEVAINSELALMLNVGDKVAVKDLEDFSTNYSGRILRINQKVDLSSQTVNVFIELKGKDLKEGMYLKANMQSKVLNNIVEVPRNLLIDQTKLYLIVDSALHLTPIKVVHQNEQSIVVRGLNDNDQLLLKPVPKAFEGMKVEPIFEELQTSIQK